jgi:hypothetical protein
MRLVHCAALCDVVVMRAVRRHRAGSGTDRGDVPGWVLVTIMTAGLVAALWAVAGDMLTDAFTSAIQDTVGGQ